MLSLGTAISQFKRRYDKARFQKAARGIAHTKPLEMSGDQPLFLSLVSHDDVHAYLVAIKSIYPSFNTGRASIIDDGTLTSEDYATLRHHVPSIEFIKSADIKLHPDTPQYIVWRRLGHILDCVADNYVIQIDSDVIALGYLDIAVEAYRKGASFILVNKVHPGTLNFTDFSNWLDSMNWTADTLQLGVERQLKTLENANQRRYVRGTAAFAGWAPGTASRADAEHFSAEARGLIGDKWLGWGSEQTTTNYLLANSTELDLLEYPLYVNNQPNLDVEDALLVHYVGTYRFYQDRYRKHALKFIKAQAPA